MTPIPARPEAPRRRFDQPRLVLPEGIQVEEVFKFAMNLASARRARRLTPQLRKARYQNSRAAKPSTIPIVPRTKAVMISPEVR